MPSDDKRGIAAHAPRRADVGLPESGFVFCSFNQSYKITPRTFDVWMRLLRQVDDSVLWLSTASDATIINLRREAQARGVEPDRLVFAARVANNADHLARHRLADLFLDTLPYNAHGTASDALWAGLPVLTHVGETFAGRVAASLLNAVGLSELIAPSQDHYERIAIDLARQPERLNAVKSRLAQHRTTMPLFDTQRYARHIEGAYVAMHERFQRNLPPDHIQVSGEG